MNLIAILLQSAPGLFIALKTWFQQNPQQQGETDDAYVARMKSESAQVSADTQATAAAIINDAPPAPVVPKTIPPGGGFNAS